jgi:hypothetical protein
MLVLFLSMKRKAVTQEGSGDRQETLRSSEKDQVGRGSADSQIKLVDPTQFAADIAEGAPIPAPTSQPTAQVLLHEPTGVIKEESTGANEFQVQPRQTRGISFGSDSVALTWVVLGVVAFVLIAAAYGGNVAFILLLFLPFYFIPTIIAVKRKHSHPIGVCLLNLFFGWSLVGWLGSLAWSLMGTPKSTLDRMESSQWMPGSLIGGGPQVRPKLTHYSDSTMRSGWRLPVYALRFFNYDKKQIPIISTTGNTSMYFVSPNLSIFYPDKSLRFDYDVRTDIRCMSVLDEKNQTNTAKTFGRVVLTGLGAGLLSHNEGALLGGGLLDYSLRGKEQYSVVGAMIVFRDFSTLVVQGQDSELRKFMSFVPPQAFSDTRVANVTEQLDRINRLASDGTRIIPELNEKISDLQKQIDDSDEELRNAPTFLVRDEIRVKQERLRSEREDWGAILNAVRHVIETTTTFEPSKDLGAQKAKAIGAGVA